MFTLKNKTNIFISYILWILLASQLGPFFLLHPLQSDLNKDM